jgi:hypothetical protein
LHARAGADLFQFALDVSQRRPTRIGRLFFTGARLNIQILSASGTKAAAALAANRPQRQREQYLLAQNVLKQDSLARVVANLSFPFGDRAFGLASVYTQRAIEQIEIPSYLGRNRLDTTGAANLDFGGKIADYANVLYDILAAAMFRQQFGPSLGLQSSGLPQIRQQLERSRRKLLGKLYFFNFQLLKTDEHRQLTLGFR